MDDASTTNDTDQRAAAAEAAGDLGHAEHETADLDVLRSVLDKTAGVIARVDPGQRALPTPCPEYDVQALLDHIVGWVQVFAAGAGKGTPPDDPANFHCGDDPAAQFRTAADAVVAGWRRYGTDRPVRVSSGEMPGEMVFSMTLMEYLAHGCDLAVATGQPLPYTAEEAEVTLRRATGMLPDEYRGDGMPFAPVVDVRDDAPAIERLLGYLGRAL